MKKKQKYGIIIVCIAVFMISIYGIYHNHEENKIKDLYPNSESELYDLTNKELNEISIKKTWYEDFHAMKSLVTIFPEHIFMFKVVEGKGDNIQSACHEYIQKLKKEYANSSQMGILNTYEEYQDETYYVLVISEKAKSIMKSIKERIQ